MNIINNYQRRGRGKNIKTSSGGEKVKISKRINRADWFPTWSPYVFFISSRSLEGKCLLRGSLISDDLKVSDAPRESSTRIDRSILFLLLLLLLPSSTRNLVSDAKAYGPGRLTIVERISS